MGYTDSEVQDFVLNQWQVFRALTGIGFKRDEAMQIMVAIIRRDKRYS